MPELLAAQTPVVPATEAACKVEYMSGPAWQIANGTIQRTLHLAEDGPHTAGLGPAAGPMLQFESCDEFLLRLEDGREVGGVDFTWSDGDESPVGEGGLAFALEGVGKDVPLRIRLIYTLLPGKTYVHKQIALQATEDQPVLVRDVQVERAKVKLGTTDLGGLGQPVFVEIEGRRQGGKDMVSARAFWGLEYPAADNRQEDGLVTLEHHPGARVGKGDWWYSKPAVFGFAEGGDAANAFRRYLAAVRRPPRPYVVYNSWYDLRRGEMTVETLIDRAREIHDELTVKRGAPFDAVVLDDGWQDRQSIWEIEAASFPDGFGPLKRALDEIGVSIGLWHPLTAVNGNLDTAWGAANGYEVAPDNRFFCLSGPRYNHALREELRRHTSEHDIDYFKHDFNAFACAGEGHGHLPEATYGREANVDAEIEMFKFLTRVNPHVYINPSGGMWLSPWWLKCVDTVWMQHCADFGYNKQVVAYEPRDWAMTYRDAALYQNLHGDRSQFPVSAIMTIGIIDGKRNRLGGQAEPLDRWANNVMVNVGRGSMLTELYITPDLLSEQQWNILAGALKWQHQYVEQMAGGRMLPVDPRWEGVYGYVHLNHDGGFVCLRNAGIVARHASVALPELGNAFFDATRVYPWRETLALERSLPLGGRAGATAAAEHGHWVLETDVEPFGVTVIEVTKALDAPVASIGGLRRSLVSWQPGEVVYDLWGSPGTEGGALIRATAVATEPEQQTELYDPESMLWRVPCDIPGEPYHLWSVEQSDDGRSFGVTVDEGVEWRFCVVARDLAKGMALALRVDGDPVEATRIEGEGWVMFTCRLPNGQHTATWEAPTGAPAPPFSARQYTVETYFVREAQLVPVRVTVKLRPGRYAPRPSPDTPCAGIQRSTWIGPKVTIIPEGSPLDVAVTAEDLQGVKAAKVQIRVFGSQGGEDYGRKWIVLNGERLGAVPVNSNSARPDAWEQAVIELSRDQTELLRRENEVVIECATGDCFKFTDLALAVQRPDGLWAETNHDPTVWCSPSGWLYEEGRTFAKRTPTIRLRFR